MFNSKSSKKALLLSLVALLVCISMLMGTTFAWFTDSVTSSGNKITSGTLDIKLLLWDGEGTDKTDYVDIGETSEAIFGATSMVAQNNNIDTIWEPGKTQVAYLAIENVGSLDLKYVVSLVTYDADGNENLYEAMRYTIIPDAQYGSAVTWENDNGVAPVVGSFPVTESVKLESGAIHYFALAIHMIEEAGNQYKDGLVEFDINVNATQLASEEDSFDNQYDKYSDFANVQRADTVGDVAGVFDMQNDSVALLPSGETSETAIALHGTGDSDSSFVIDGTNTVFTDGLGITSHQNLNLSEDAVLTIDGITVEGVLSVKTYFKNIVIKNVKADSIEINNMGSVTVENCVFDGAADNGIYVTPYVDGYNLTLKDNTIKNSGKNGVQIAASASGVSFGAGELVVEGNTFESWCAIGDKPRAAFKVWGDAIIAPTDVASAADLTNAAKDLAAYVGANNTFVPVAGNANQVRFDFYGFVFDSLN